MQIEKRNEMDLMAGSFAPGHGPSAQLSNFVDYRSGAKVVFQITNGRTSIFNLDLFLAGIFDQECRYPSPTAIAMESGWSPPDGEDSNWDGWIRMFHQPKTIPPWVPTGLLPRITRLAEKYGYAVEVDDLRERPESGFPEFGDLKLRDYQTEAVRLALAAGRGVLDMVPRAGKTRTMVEILRQIALPTIWIAPTDRIVRQTLDVIDGFFGKNFAHHQVGSKGWEEHVHTHVVLCTASTAVNLPQEFYDSREVLLVDEWHHGAAKSYREIFQRCEHIYYRYGMTGTFFRSSGDALAMHALLSETIYKVSSQALLDRGFLVPTKAVYLPVLAPRLRGIPPGFITGHGKYGIHEHEYRNNLVTYAAVTLHQIGRKVLILVGTKKQGRLIQKMISGYLPQPRDTQFKRVEFISTDTDRKRQGKILEAYLESDEVQILIGTSLLGEGVDLPVVDALVYARGERAEVTLTQNAYRVCTAISGKEDAIVVDFADRHNAKLMRHSRERLAVFYNEPTFDVTVLQDPGQFSTWLRDQHAA